MISTRMIDDDLKLDNYSGKLPLYKIRAIRHYQYLNRDKCAKWNKNHYEKNSEEIKYNIGRRRAINRINAGCSVSQKTRIKYNIEI